jgi:hypothetical protein
MAEEEKERSRPTACTFDPRSRWNPIHTKIDGTL